MAFEKKAKFSPWLLTKTLLYQLCFGLFCFAFNCIFSGRYWIWSSRFYPEGLTPRNDEGYNSKIKQRNRHFAYFIIAQVLIFLNDRPLKMLKL